MVDPARRVLVIGAGGHARVCVEALQDDPNNTVVGCVSRHGSAIEGLGVDLLGRDVDIGDISRRLELTHAFVAIGDNTLRAEAYAFCVDVGLESVSAISRFACVSSTATVQSGSAVLPGAAVNAAAVIGHGSIINTNASVDHDCDVGEFVHVAPGATVAGGVAIGHRAFLGIGSRVIPGLRIGDGATVGAGAVVLRDVPDGATVVGVPARSISQRRGDRV